MSVTTDATTASWTLQAKDQGAAGGKMVAAASGCTGSDSTLRNLLQLSVTTTAPGVTSAGMVSLSSTNQTIATATNQTPLSTAILTTNYSQVIPLSELMRTGCAYTITVTYTVQ